MATVSQAELKKRTLDTMEDDLKISAKQAADFIASLKAVIEESVENGDKVSLWGIVTLTPKGVLAKKKRTGTDPRTGEEREFDAKPASVKVSATVGKVVKEALPETDSKAGKALLKEARERAAAAKARAEERAAAAA